MVRKYERKKDNPRATINLGKKGEPFRDLFEKHSKKFDSATDFFRDAVMTLYSDDLGYKERKIQMLKFKFVQSHNDAKLAVDERKKIEAELVKAGATDEEISMLYNL